MVSEAYLIQNKEQIEPKKKKSRIRFITYITIYNVFRQINQKDKIILPYFLLCFFFSYISLEKETIVQFVKINQKKKRFLIKLIVNVCYIGNLKKNIATIKNVYGTFTFTVRLRYVTFQT